mgnify:CR=1 FL=1
MTQIVTHIVCIETEQNDVFNAKISQSTELEEKPWS